MARNPWDYVIAAGYVVTGAGLLGRLFASDSPAVHPGAPVGELQRPKKGLLGMPKVKRAELRDIKSIEDRAAVIAKLIKKGGLDHRIHEAAKQILARKCKDTPTGWCVEPKNWKAEVLALYAASTDPKLSKIAVRYTRDMLRADTFSSAERTFLTNGEDCDGMVVFLGSLLESVGHPVRLKIIQQKGRKSWSHIYLQTGLPPDRPSEWMSLDPSVWPKRPPGWEAPSDMVERSRIFNIE